MRHHPLIPPHHTHFSFPTHSIVFTSSRDIPIHFFCLHLPNIPLCCWHVSYPLIVTLAHLMHPPSSFLMLIYPASLSVCTCNPSFSLHCLSSQASPFPPTPFSRFPLISLTAVETVPTPPRCPHPICSYSHFLSLFWVLCGSKVYLGAIVFCNCIHSYTYDLHVHLEILLSVSPPFFNTCVHHTRS